MIILLPTANKMSVDIKGIYSAMLKHHRSVSMSKTTCGMCYWVSFAGPDSFAWIYRLKARHTHES